MMKLRRTKFCRQDTFFVPLQVDGGLMGARKASAGGLPSAQQASKPSEVGSSLRSSANFYPLYGMQREGPWASFVL